MDVLTRRQRAIYEFIRDKIVNRGYGPTVREIGARFRISSPNGVMCHLKALEKKGGTLAGSPGGFYVTGGEGPLKEGEVERAAAWAKGLVGGQT